MSAKTTPISWLPSREDAMRQRFWNKTFANNLPRLLMNQLENEKQKCFPLFYLYVQSRIIFSVQFCPFCICFEILPWNSGSLLKKRGILGETGAGHFFSATWIVPDEIFCNLIIPSTDYMYLLWWCTSKLRKVRSGRIPSWSKQPRRASTWPNISEFRASYSANRRKLCSSKNVDHCIFGLENCEKSGRVGKKVLGQVH